MNTRPICTKESLLSLCSDIAARPELQHIYDKDHFEEGLNVIDISEIDMDETYPDVYGLPDKFRVLYPDTYLKLKFIWQNLIELHDLHQFKTDASNLVNSIDGVPLGITFSFTFHKYDIEEWEKRTKFFHDIIDDAEARIALMQPDNPIKLKRFPFAFGDWLQVVQTEDGTKSVAVSTGGPLGGDRGAWVEFTMVKPFPAMPDRPYPFEENDKCDRDQQVGVEYTWLAGPVLADWFVNGSVKNADLVQLMDMYIRDGEFNQGPLTETMDEICARFNQEHPPEDD